MDKRSLKLSEVWKFNQTNAAIHPLMKAEVTNSQHQCRSKSNPKEYHITYTDYDWLFSSRSMYYSHEILTTSLKKKKKAVCSNVKDGERKTSGSGLLFESIPKIKRVYSGLWPFLHPSFVKIHSVFLCNPADKPTNQPTYGHCQKCSFLGGGIHDKLCAYNLFRSYSFQLFLRPKNIRFMNTCDLLLYSNLFSSIHIPKVALPVMPYSSLV